MNLYLIALAHILLALWAVSGKRYITLLFFLVVDAVTLIYGNQGHEQQAAILFVGAFDALCLLVLFLQRND